MTRVVDSSPVESLSARLDALRHSALDNEMNRFEHKWDIALKHIRLVVAPHPHDETCRHRRDFVQHKCPTAIDELGRARFDRRSSGVKFRR